MPALNVGVNSTFEQQRQIINSIAVDVFALSTTLTGLTTNGLVVTYSNSAGVATYASVAGIATYATISGISSYAVTSGIATIANYASVAGVASALNFVPNYTHNAGVASYATVAGIATNANYATSSSSSTFAFYAGISTYSGSAGVATVAQGLTGTPNVQVGVITASLFVGDGSELTGVNYVETASYASISGYSTSSGISTYALTSGIATYSSLSGIATYANNSGVSTYASTSGISTYSLVAGIATYSNTSGISTYASTSGVATVAQGLTGIPNVRVGVITASFFVGDGSGLTGVGGVGGSGINYWEKNNPGINTTSNVGIATTNPQTPLQVERYGVKTGIGTFNASVGVTTDIDTFTISQLDFKVVEYTLHVGYGTYIQAQKILIMQNGTTSYSQEYSLMYEPSLIVSVGSTISGGSCKLQVTPEIGITGLTTYRFIRQSML
jgi:hypothetical protein